MMGAREDFSIDKLYDVIIVGGGPAGLTAAIYLARAKYRVLVIEKEQFGGQITITHEMVNYPGVGRISGKELTDIMRRQADFFGAEFLLADVESLELEDDVKTVCTSRGDFHCFGVLLATGAHPRTVGFAGEAEHKGRGVAYCATCDGEFFTGKDVFVVGGGFAAAEESVFLTKFARHVTILIREEDFTCAAAVADGARNHEKITVFTDTIVEEVSGEDGLNYIRYKNTATGEVTEFRARDGESFGVFVFAGYAPATSLVEGVAELDEYGYVVTDRAQKTNIEGLYAAGDVCIKPLRQVVTATGDGALAATELEKYASHMQRRTGLHPTPPTQKGEQPLSLNNNNQPLNQLSDDGEIFTSEMKAQLNTVFERMERSLVLKLYLDSRPISNELEEYMTNLTSFSDKLRLQVEERNASSDFAPCVKVCLDGLGLSSNETKGQSYDDILGLSFHGVPGGHEFTSFVLGLYNAAGPGQSIDEEVRQRIVAVDKCINMKILVTLSCNMCPDLVIAAQRIAAENPNVTADVYDINHFERIKKQFNVMSVPCLVINDEHVFFGKKNINELLDLIENISIDK